jgi:hypothetical protein
MIPAQFARNSLANIACRTLMGGQGHSSDEKVSIEESFPIE